SSHGSLRLRTGAVQGVIGIFDHAHGADQRRCQGQAVAHMPCLLAPQRNHRPSLVIIFRLAHESADPGDHAAACQEGAIVPGLPPRRARARAQSRAKAVEKCPNPRLASTTAATSVACTSVGRAAGCRAPRSASPTYCGTRMTPWESWPERLARIRCAATTPAISSSAPMALKTASTYVCSGA